MYTNCGFKLNSINSTIFDKFIEVYKWVGYQNLFFEVNFPLEFDLSRFINEINMKYKINLFPKTIIRPHSLNHLRDLLSKISQFKNILVAIESTDKDILSFSAHDSRIDIISVTSTDLIKELTPGIISLLKQNSGKKFIEVSLIDAFSSKNYQRSKIFREIYKIISLVVKSQDLIIYGGQELKINHIRGPIEITNIFNTIFEIPLNISKRFVRENPQILINKLIQRTDKNYIENGIRIIESKDIQGED